MKGQVAITPREVRFPTPAWPKMFPFETEGYFDTWNKFLNTYRPFETLNVQEQTLHIPVEIAETEKELLVSAEVPGFTEKDLEVRVEPNRLFITGRIYDTKEDKGKKTLYTERIYNQIFRYVDLPMAVNADKATATVKDGMLKITLSKAQPPKLIPVSTIS
jgi:HSP20 family molecular chaperone IbpA